MIRPGQFGHEVKPEGIAQYDEGGELPMHRKLNVVILAFAAGLVGGFIQSSMAPVAVFAQGQKGRSKGNSGAKLCPRQQSRQPHGALRV
jgi:hypothetical protein